MTGASPRRGEEGQVAPALLLGTLLLALVGWQMLRFGAATALTAEATSAADAAALAAVAEVGRGWGLAEAAVFATTGAMPPGFERRADEAAADYAAANGATLVDGRFEPAGPTAIRYVATVRTTASLDGDEPTRRAVAEIGFEVPGLAGAGGGGCMTAAEVEAVEDRAGVDLGFVSGLQDCGSADTRNLADGMKVAVVLLEDEMGGPTRITSAYRSVAEQAAIWVSFGCPADPDGCRGRAAPPGRSFHQLGLAVDLANWSQALDALGRDPSIPLCHPLPGDDDVHFAHRSTSECGGPVTASGFVVSFTGARLVG